MLADGVRSGQTLVDVATLVVVRIALMSGRALALERSDRIHTLAAQTEARDRFALVYVDTLSAMYVLEVALVAGQLRGALLAGVAPGAAHGGAAQLLGAHHSGQLACAHLVGHSRETRPRAVVCFTSTASESINTGATVWPNASACIQARLSTVGFSTVLAVIAGPADAFALLTSAVVETGQSAVVDP